MKKQLDKASWLSQICRFTDHFKLDCFNWENLGSFFTTRDVEFDDDIDNENNIDGEDEDGNIDSDNRGGQEIQDSVIKGDCETGKQPKVRVHMTL